MYTIIPKCLFSGQVWGFNVSTTDGNIDAEVLIIIENQASCRNIKCLSVFYENEDMADGEKVENLKYNIWYWSKISDVAHCYWQA